MSSQRGKKYQDVLKNIEKLKGEKKKCLLRTTKTIGHHGDPVLVQSLGLSNTRDSFNKLFSGKKAIRKTPKFSQTRPLEVSINLCPVWLSFGLLLAVGFVHHFLLENQFAKHLLCVFRSQEDTDCDVTLSTSRDRQKDHFELESWNTAAPGLLNISWERRGASRSLSQ